MGQKIAFATSQKDLTPKPNNFKITERHGLSGATRQRDGTDNEWKKTILEQNGLFSGFVKFSPNGELWDGSTVDDPSFTSSFEISGPGFIYDPLIARAQYDQYPIILNIPNRKRVQNDPESILVGDGTEYAGPFTLQEAADICWRAKYWKINGFSGQGSTLIKFWQPEFTNPYTGEYSPEELTIVSATAQINTQENRRNTASNEEKSIVSGSSAQGSVGITNKYPNFGHVFQYEGVYTAYYCYEDPFKLQNVWSLNGGGYYNLQGSCGSCDTDPKTVGSCEGENTGSYFYYSFDFGKPVVSLKNDPSKYYIAFNCSAQSHSFGDLPSYAYVGIVDYSGSAELRDITLSSIKPLGVVTENGVVDFENFSYSDTFTPPPDEFGGNYGFTASYTTTATQRTINIVTPGSGRLVPVKMYGTSSYSMKQTYGSVSAPACSLLDSPLTLEPDKYWEYDDGNGNPIWDKDTGAMLRDPVTGATV